MSTTMEKLLEARHALHTAGYGPGDGAQWQTMQAIDAAFLEFLRLEFPKSTRQPGEMGGDDYPRELPLSDYQARRDMQAAGVTPAYYQAAPIRYVATGGRFTKERTR